MQPRTAQSRLTRSAIIAILLVLAIPALLGGQLFQPANAATVILGTYGHSTTAVATGSATVTAVVAGNVLVAAFSTPAAITAFTMSDSACGAFSTWIQAGTTASDTATARIYYCTATTAVSGTDTITASWTTSTEYTLDVYKLSGYSTSGVTAQTGTGTGTAVATTSLAFGSGAFLVSMDGQTATETATIGTGYTKGDATTTLYGHGEYSSSGVTSPATFGITLGGSTTWAEVGAQFPVSATVGTYGKSTTAVTTGSATITSVAVGNIVVAAFSTSAAITSLSISDSACGAFSNWTQAGTASDTAEAFIYYCTATTAEASETVSASWTTSARYTLDVYVLSGYTTSGVTSQSGTGTTTAVATSSLSYGGGAFLVSIMGSIATETTTVGTGFTTGDVATTLYGHGQYAVSGVTSPTTFPMTLGGSTTWAEVGAQFPLAVAPGTYGSSTTSVTSGSATVTGVAAGDVIVAAFSSSATISAFTISDSACGADSNWSQAGSTATNTATAGIYYCTATTAESSDTITVGWTTASGYTLDVYDLAGYTTSGLTAATGTGSTTAVATSSLTFSTGAFVVAIDGTTATETNTVGSGFTTEDASTTALYGHGEYTSYEASGVSSPTTSPMTLGAATTWAEAAAQFPIAVVQPITVTMAESAPFQTVTLSGCGVYPTSITSTTTVYATAAVSCGISLTFPSPPASTQYVWSTDSATATVTSCASGNCAASSLTAYTQFSDTIQITDSSPGTTFATFASGATIAVTYTSLGASTGGSCTITTPSTGTTASSGCTSQWIDYDGNVNYPSTAGGTVPQTSGRWATGNTGTGAIAAETVSIGTSPATVNENYFDQLSDTIQVTDANAPSFVAGATIQVYYTSLGFGSATSGQTCTITTPGSGTSTSSGCGTEWVDYSGTVYYPGTASGTAPQTNGRWATGVSGVVGAATESAGTGASTVSQAYYEQLTNTFKISKAGSASFFDSGLTLTVTGTSLGTGVNLCTTTTTTGSDTSESCSAYSDYGASASFGASLAGAGTSIRWEISTGTATSTTTITSGGGTFTESYYKQWTNNFAYTAPSTGTFNAPLFYCDQLGVNSTTTLTSSPAAIWCDTGSTTWSTNPLTGSSASSTERGDSNTARPTISSGSSGTTFVYYNQYSQTLSYNVNDGGSGYSAPSTAGGQQFGSSYNPALTTSATAYWFDATGTLTFSATLSGSGSTEQWAENSVSVSLTSSNTQVVQYYNQYKETLSYTVVDGGSPSAPTATGQEYGSAYAPALTTSATAYWFDATGTVAFSTPTATNEQWAPSPSSVSATASNTQVVSIYNQYKQTLSYSVVDGGSPSAPTATGTSLGSAYAPSLTTSAVGYWFDATGSITVSTPTSGANERWAPSPSSVSATSSNTQAVSMYNQYQQTLSYAINDGGSGYSAPATVGGLELGSAYNPTLTTSAVGYWFDSTGTLTFTNPLTCSGGCPTGERWSENSVSVSLTSANTQAVQYYNQYDPSVSYAAEDGGSPTGNALVLSYSSYGSGATYTLTVTPTAEWMDAASYTVGDHYVSTTERYSQEQNGTLSGSTAIVFDVYHQFKETLSYSVVYGGSPSSPTASGLEYGSSSNPSLTTSATGYWFDASGSIAFSTPTATNEQWAPSPSSVSATAANTQVVSLYNQYKQTLSYSVVDGGSPTAPTATGTSLGAAYAPSLTSSATAYWFDASGSIAFSTSTGTNERWAPSPSSVSATSSNTQAVSMYNQYQQTLSYNVNDGGSGYGAPSTAGGLQLGSAYNPTLTTSATSYWFDATGTLTYPTTLTGSGSTERWAENSLSVTLTSSNTQVVQYYNQYKETLSYTVVYGGSPSAPTASGLEYGASYAPSLSTSATGYWFDASGSVTFSTPTGTNEQWAPSPASVSATSSNTQVASMYNQYQQTLSYSVVDGGSPSAPTATGTSLGVAYAPSLTSSPSPYWFDATGSITVSTPTSGANERWSPSTGSISATSSNTQVFSIYNQYQETLSYSVVYGGSPSAPTATGLEYGSAYAPTLTTSATGYWFDATGSISFSTPTGTNEQWAPSPSTVSATGATTQVVSLYNQYKQTLSYSVIDGGSPSAPTATGSSLGATYSPSLSTTATSFWFDATGTIAFSTPTGTNERWAPSMATIPATSSNTQVVDLYNQYSLTLSYSISDGGSGYSAPAISCTQFGSGYNSALTGTASAYWCDDSQSWGVSSNPLTGSGASERWYTSQGLSGTVSGALTTVFTFHNQYSESSSYSGAVAASGAPSLVCVQLGTPASTALTTSSAGVWCDGSGAFTITKPSADFPSSTERYETNFANGSISSAGSIDPVFYHQFKPSVSYSEANGGTPTGNALVLSYSSFGSGSTYTLTSTPTAEWMDAASYTVGDHYVSTTERYSQDQNGSLSSSSAMVFDVYHQFAASSSYSGSVASGGAPSLAGYQFGVAASTPLTTTPTQVWLDSGSAYSVTKPTADFPSTVERYEDTFANGTVTSSVTVSPAFYHQFYAPASYSTFDSSTIPGGDGSVTLTIVQFGSSETPTLTTTATSYWADSGSSWSVTPNVLPSSPSGERWDADNVGVSGTVSSSTTIAPDYLHQYLLTVTGGNGITYGTASPTSDGWYDAGSSTTVSSNWVWNTVSGQSRSAVTNYEIDGVSQNPTRAGSGTLTTSSVTFNAAHTVAFLSTTQYYLTVSGGNGISYGTASPTGDNWYDSGASTTVSSSGVYGRASGTGQRVASWSVDGGSDTSVATAGTATTSSVTMSTYHTVSFNSVTQYLLTDNDPSGSEGSITAPTIAGDTGWYDSGTSVTIVLNNVYGLVADSSRNNLVSYTQGGSTTPVTRSGSGTVTESTIVMSGPTTVSASYVVQYYLAISTDCYSAEASATSPTGDGWYDSGTSLDVQCGGINSRSGGTGKRATDYYWDSGSATTEATTATYTTSSVTMSSAHTLNVDSVVQFQVSFAASPSEGGSASTSTATPISGDTGWYDSGSVITITADPSAYWSFSSWSASTGSITITSGSSESTTATIGGTGTITADFAVTTPLSAGSVTPSSPTIDQGQSITLTADASGGTNSYTSYQWYTASGCSSAISGATSAVYATSPSSSTTYYYEVTDSSSASACSPGDTVTVDHAPTVSISPTSVTMDKGQSVVLTATPSQGTGTFAYSWSVASGSCPGFSDSGTSTLTFTPSGTTSNCVLKVTLTDTGTSDGATPTVTATPSTDSGVTVDSALSMSLELVSTVTIDSGQSYEFVVAASGGAGPYSYAWSLPSGVSSVLGCGASSTTCTATSSTPGSYTVSVTVTDTGSQGSGGSVSSSSSMTVEGALEAPVISVAPATLDSGQSGDLTTTTSFSGGASPYTCQWLVEAPGGSYGDLGSSFSCSAGDTPTVSTGALASTGSWSFELKVTDTGNPAVTVDSNAETVTVNPTLSVSISPTGPSIDEGQSILLTADPTGGSGSYTAYQWYTGPGCTGAISGATSSTYSASPSSTTSYYVKVTDSLSGTACSSADSVTVSSALSASISPSSPSIDSGQSVLLTATATGGTTPYTAYAWYAGSSCSGSSLASGATFSPSPSSTTTYSVLITDSANAPSTACSAGDVVTVESALSISSSLTSTVTIDSGQTYAYAVAASGGIGPYAYSWSLPSGVSASAGCGTADSTCTITSSTPGTYAVSVRVTDTGSQGSGGSVSSSSALTVDSSLAVSSGLASPVALDSGLTYDYSVAASGGTGTYTYSWSVPSGVTESPTCTSSDSTCTITSSTPGTYTVSVTVTDTGSQGSGGSVSSSSTLTIHGALEVSVAPVSVDPGQTASLTATASGGSGSYTTFAWYVGGSCTGSPAQSSGSDSFTTATLSSTTEYCVTVADSTGATSSATVQVTVNGALSVSVSPATIDQGQTASLTATASGGSGSYATYAWYSGASCTGTALQTSTSNSYTTPTLTTTTEYCVSVTDSLGESASTTATVTVNGPLTVTVSPVTIDSGQTAALTATASGGSGSYSNFAWYLGSSCTGNSLQSSASGSYTTGTLASTTGYCVEVTDSLTGTATTTVTVTVNPAPSLSVSGQTIDSGQTATLTAVATGGSGSYATYAWYSGSSCTGTPLQTGASDAFTTPALTVTTGYCALVTDSIGGTASTTVTVTVSGALSITVSPVSIDSGQTATLTGVPSGGSGSYTAYSWYSGSACTGTPLQSGSSAYYTTASLTSSTTYCAQVTDSRGGSATTTVTVSINPGLGVSVAPTSVDSGQTATLTAVATGGSGSYALYTWYAGESCSGGSLRSGSSDSYTTASLVAGASFCVQVTDSLGGTATGTVTVTINPTLAVSVSPATIDQGQTTSLTADASGGSGSYSTFSWYVGSSCTGNAAQSSASDAYTTASLSSDAEYCVAVTDSIGGTATSTVTVTVNPPLSVSVSPVTVDFNQTASLTAVASGGSGSYAIFAWYLGDSCTGTPAQSAASSAYTTPLLTSTTSYCVAVVDTLGGTATTTVSATVSGVLSDSVSPVTVDSGQAGALTATATGGSGSYVEYDWYLGTACIGTALQSSASDAYTTPALSSTTDYCVVVTDSLGSNATTTVTVTVNAPLSVSVSPASVDSGQSASLTASPSQGSGSYVSYAWYSGAICSGSPLQAGSSSSYTTAALTANTGYCVELTDSLGGTATATVTVTINPALSVSVAPVSVDSGQTASLTATATGGSGSYASYSWYAGDTCSGSPLQSSTSDSYTTASLTSETEYCVMLTDSLGGTAAATVAVSVNPAISVAVSPVTVDSGQAATLTAEATQGSGSYVLYTWYAGESCSGAPLRSSSSATFGAGALSVTSTFCVAVSDSVGGTATATGTVTVDPALIVPKPAATSNPADVGGSVTFSVAVSGGSGTGTYTYLWSGLPAGTCSSATGATVTCSPTTTSGSPFSVAVSVTDANGNTVAASSSLSFVVNPAVTLGALSSSGGPTVDVGHSTTLSTSGASGGTGAYQYVWTDLPDGCSASDSPAITCTPSDSVGSPFTVTLTVTDANGETVEATLNLAVDPALVAPVISTSQATIQSGESATLSTTTSFSGGASPYACEWLAEAPGSQYAILGSPFGCDAGSLPTTSIGALTNVGTWSFELMVTDASGATATSGPAMIEVTPPPNASSVSVTCSPSVVAPGMSAVCVADVSGASPTGTVTFEATSGTFAPSATCTLASGTCSVTFVAPSSAGRSAMTASYSGDPENSASSGSSSVSVPSFAIAVPGGSPGASISGPTGSPVTMSGSGFASSTDYYYCFEAGALSPSACSSSQDQLTTDSSGAIPTSSGLGGVGATGLVVVYDPASGAVVAWAQYTAIPPASGPSAPAITVSPPTGTAQTGVQLTVTGTNFAAGATITLSYSGGVIVVGSTITVSPTGGFTALATILAAQPGSSVLTAIGSDSPSDAASTVYALTNVQGYVSASLTASSSGTATIDQTATTGVMVTIQDAPNASGQVTISNLGAPATGVGALSLSGTKYYDVLVTNLPGTGSATVCITDASITPSTELYWAPGGSSFVVIASTFDAPDTLCTSAPISLSQLGGTNFAIGTPSTGGGAGSLYVSQTITLTPGTGGGPVSFSLSGCGVIPSIVEGDGQAHHVAAYPGCKVSVSAVSTGADTRTVFAGGNETVEFASCSGLGCSSSLNATYYVQMLQTLSYSVTGGADGSSAPVVAGLQFGSAFSVTLTTTPEGYWMDATGGISLPSLLAGSGTQERWSLVSFAGVLSADAPQSLVLVYAHQYAVVLAVSPQGAGTTTPSGQSWLDASSPVAISAVPSSGYSFSGWAASSGAIALANLSAASTTLVANGAGTLTANFAPSMSSTSTTSTSTTSTTTSSSTTASSSTSSATSTTSSSTTSSSTSLTTSATSTNSTASTSSVGGPSRAAAPNADVILSAAAAAIAATMILLLPKTRRRRRTSA